MARSPVQVVERAVVGLCGDDRGWTSLGRTLRAYEAALARHYTVVRIDSLDGLVATGVAAVVNFSGSVGWLARAHLGFPVVVCLHGGGTVDCAALPALLGLLGPGDTVIGNCPGDTALVRHLSGGDPARVAQLSLPVAGEFRPCSPQPLLDALGIPPGAAVLGFVGRVTPKKGVHHVLRVVHRLRRRLRREVYGIVVGDVAEDSLLDYRGRSYREYVHGLTRVLGLADRIRFLPGGLPVAVLAQLYSAVDVLVHPSTSVDENFGYAPREALACGASVAVTDYGGLRNADLDIPEVRRVPTWVTAGGLRFDRDLLADAVQDMLAAERTAVRRPVVTCGTADFDGALQHIVDEHLQATRCLGGPRTAPIGLPSSSSLLPPTQPDWSVVREAARFYVSDAVPGGDGPWQAWPATRSGSRITVEDPAWPATIEVSDAEWAEYRHVHDLGRARLRNPDRCARLVEVGALVPATRP